jgi:hypothetical protein
VDLRSWLVLALLVLIAPIAGMALARDNPPMARHLVDFQAAESTANWSAIDDAVMGGVSSSRLRHDPAGHAVFEGASRWTTTAASPRCVRGPGNWARREP